MIESADSHGNRWSTVGVSENIVDASFDCTVGFRFVTSCIARVRRRNSSRQRFCPLTCVPMRRLLDASLLDPRSGMLRNAL
jgi:hypothetical protein